MATGRGQGLQPKGAKGSEQPGARIIWFGFQGTLGAKDYTPTLGTGQVLRSVPSQSGHRGTRKIRALLAGRGRGLDP